VILFVAPEIASETPACMSEACSTNGLFKSIYIIIMDINYHREMEFARTLSFINERFTL
jgi:hypothetical protein